MDRWVGGWSTPDQTGLLFVKKYLLCLFFCEQGPALPRGKRNSLVVFFNDILPSKIANGKVMTKKK